MHLAKYQCEKQAVGLATGKHDSFMQELGQDPDIYEKLTASFAPNVCNMDDVKKGLLCQLFGGITKVTASYFRSQAHPDTRASKLHSIPFF